MRGFRLMIEAADVIYWAVVAVLGLAALLLAATLLVCTFIGLSLLWMDLRIGLTLLWKELRDWFERAPKRWRWR